MTAERHAKGQLPVMDQVRVREGTPVKEPVKASPVLEVLHATEVKLVMPLAARPV